jgi:hypothetical protein
MTLTDFESVIDAKILERGLEYYQDGQVISMESDGTSWIADVSGSDDYTVTVGVSKSGKITEMDCDCPYDFGPVCKHEAAVLYALRNMGADATKKTGPAKIEKLASALENAAKDELIAIIIGYAKKNRLMRNELLARFSGDVDLLSSVREMIKSSVAAYMSGGFVEYGDVDGAVDGALSALEIARSKKDVDAVTAVSVCIIVLREMVHLVENSDDSDGVAGGVVDDALQLMRDSVGGYAVSGGSADSSKLLDIMLNHAKEKIYDGWNEWRLEIAEACVPFCADVSLRQKLETYLDSFVSAKKNNSYDGWASNGAQKIRRGIIEKFDGAEAADAYLEKNLERNEDFRSIAIEKAIAAKNYDRALRLCLDGEKKYNKNSGLVDEYRHIRYVVYESQKDIAGQKELARAFVLDGEFEYYEKLKNLYTKAEWADVLAGLIEKLEKARDALKIYIDICIHERFLERLLAVCQKQPYYLTALYPHLVPQYAAELSPVFSASVRKSAGTADNRSNYQEVCKLIRHYMKACGKQDANKLIEELRETYRRRPAFIDELGKI